VARSGLWFAALLACSSCFPAPGSGLDQDDGGVADASGAGGSGGGGSGGGGKGGGAGGGAGSGGTAGSGGVGGGGSGGVTDAGSGDLREAAADRGNVDAPREGVNPNCPEPEPVSTSSCPVPGTFCQYGTTNCFCSSPDAGLAGSWFCYDNSGD